MAMSPPVASNKWDWRTWCYF